MSKDYLYEPGPPVYPIRANSRDRQYRSPANPYENQFYQNNQEISRRDIMYEMKRQQRLAPNISESYASNQSSLEIPYNPVHQVRDFQDRSLEFSEISKIQQAGPKRAENAEFESPVSQKKIEADKKKLYAEELRRQIEEKNMIKAYQKDRKENTEERPRYASADRGNPSQFTGNDPKLAEREKKIQYARELEAQIRQKREGNVQAFKKNEEFFPFPNEGVDKKKAYARELEEQIRSRQRPDYQKEAFSGRKEIEEGNRGVLDRARGEPDGQSAELEKKLRYKQELDRQMEEQKKRKEEEKRRKKMEDDVVEVGYFRQQEPQIKGSNLLDKGGDKNDLRAPDKFHKAEELKKREIKEEVPYDWDLKNMNVPEPFEYKNIVESSFENKRFYNPEPSYDRDLKNMNVPEPFEYKNIAESNLENKRFYNPEPSIEGKKQTPDYPNGVPSYRPANEILSPFDQDRQHKGIAPGKSIFNPNTQLIENYIKEIQEVRLERDRAREQCLEMRELMLREKEKNLEQMLIVIRNQNENIYDKPPVYPVKSASSLKDPDAKTPYLKNDYAAAAFDQVHKQLFMPGYVQPSEAGKNYQNEPFEKSLRSNSEFIAPNTTKWGEPSTGENHAAKPRKKWGNLEESQPENPSFSKFSLEKMTGLNEISEVDESLPGNNTYLSPKNDEDLFKEFEAKYITKMYEMQEKDSPVIENEEQREQISDIDRMIKENLERDSSQKNLSRKSSSRGQRAFNRLQEAKSYANDLENLTKKTEN